MLALVEKETPNQFYDCVSCGACCAHFRVSFYSGETNFHFTQGVPIEFVELISPFRVSMLGTNKQSPRCVALAGEIGKEVSCSIYTYRSSACRNFDAGSEACVRARMAHGLEFETEHVA